MLTCNYILYPYVEGGHWSLIIFNLLEKDIIFMNSLSSIHGKSKLAAKLIVGHLSTTNKDYNIGAFKYYDQKVPLQTYSTSCGWRVLANAWRYLESRFRMTTLTLHDYPESWVTWVRDKAVSMVLERSINPNDPESPLPPKKGRATKGLDAKKMDQKKKSPAKKIHTKKKDHKTSPAKGKSATKKKIPAKGKSPTKKKIPAKGKSPNKKIAKGKSPTKSLAKKKSRYKGPSISLTIEIQGSKASYT
ncbi:hypothetical protein GOP47_0015187 [Adiantum capillus-veneris]|uniref:Ubiquitin-like protease family profile domain-containing protein n=1 Tax=Adiantum capillus-veneris TaxID=13818 RepID=A0A9D4UNG6_ADICA|nr:hypothetical protein GOP47_0015187 [Adiantum capillus-veneris]